MRHFLAGIATLFCFAFTSMQHARTDMGPAIAPEQPLMVLTGKTFDGWCRSKYKDCKISIEGESLLIDNRHRVAKDQITSWSRSDEFRDASGFIGPHHLYTYEFRYKKPDGNYEKGWIVFQNSKASDSFFASIKRWAAAKEHRCQYNFDTRRVVCD